MVTGGWAAGAVAVLVELGDCAGLADASARPSAASRTGLADEFMRGKIRSGTQSPRQRRTPIGSMEPRKRRKSPVRRAGRNSDWKTFRPISGPDFQCASCAQNDAKINQRRFAKIIPGARRNRPTPQCHPRVELEWCGMAEVRPRKGMNADAPTGPGLARRSAEGESSRTEEQGPSQAAPNL